MSKSADRGTRYVLDGLTLIIVYLFFLLTGLVLVAICCELELVVNRSAYFALRRRRFYRHTVLNSKPNSKLVFHASAASSSQ